MANLRKSELFTSIFNPKWQKIDFHLVFFYKERWGIDERRLVDEEVKNGTTIRLSLSVISAFSAEAIVTVNTPSYVWCDALQGNDELNVEKLLKTDRKQYISSTWFFLPWFAESATAELLTLNPGTRYNMICVAVPYS